MNFYFIINFYLFIIYSSNYEFMFASNFYIFIHFLFLFVSFSIYSLHNNVFAKLARLYLL